MRGLVLSGIPNPADPVRTMARPGLEIAMELYIIQFADLIRERRGRPR